MAAPRKKPVKPAEPEPPEFIASSTSPLVFISHDTRDAELAEAFSVLLSDVSGGVLKSFRSSDRKGTTGIEYGAEWYRSVMSKLDQATDVVALLTAQSFKRPWILYEAGVAKGKLNTTVLGLAIGVPLSQANDGPFGQFQNLVADEASLIGLVVQLMGRVPGASPREEAVRRQVQAFLATIEDVLEKEAKVPTVAPKSDPKAIPKTDGDASAKMFEEVKAIARELPKRVAEASRLASFNKAETWSPYISSEDKQLLGAMFSEDRARRAVGWSIYFGQLRDSIPWLFDLGLRFSKAVSEDDSTAADRIRWEIIYALDFFEKAPTEANRPPGWKHTYERVSARLVQFNPVRGKSAVAGKILPPSAPIPLGGE